MSELDEEDIAKIVGQFVLALNRLMKPLRRFGQNDYVDMASAEITHLAWQMHWRLEGVDTPYEVEEVHW